MAAVDDKKSGSPAQPGMMQTLIPLLLLTLIGGGGGTFLGYTLAAPPPAGQAAQNPPPDAGSEHADAHGDPHKKGGGHGDAKKKAPDLASFEVKELPAIVTNLAQPESSWIRLQAAIVYDPKELPHAEKLIAELTADITAFLRTASISSLEGSDGLRRLQEELGERATIRSERKVKEFIIETMVVQ
ncbi:flagellar basal body-associated FliL family protein [Methylocystis sp. WRRC1]|uniref:flagellar basal body-associated FliL family protein n=1 Tax=Methylocystis sp. WRRC1 TaxID=1732014 RepID=UPI001D13C04D|nr:flagellar basal body-associated FliL family protein [Methylocystis sp. WRRC1]MCC3245293.1 flagellar basal body-associated FliL family protein [Methylocystis sp. WRRC1]